MKEKYKKILMYIGLFLILFYPFNISFKDYIFPNEFCNLLLQIIGITLICIPNFKDIVNNIKKNYKVILPVFVMIGVFIFFRNGDICNKHFGMPFYIVEFFTIIFVLISNDKWNRIFGNVLMLFIIEHVLATWFCFIFKDFYYNNILILFQDFKEELLYQYEHRQIAGITHHYSTNAIYLFLGIVFEIYNFNYNIKESKINIFSYIILILNIGALLLTGKRAQVFLGMLSFIIVFIINNKGNVFKIIKKHYKKLVIAIILIITIIGFIPSFREPFMRLYDGVKNKDMLITRKPMYSLAIDKFKQKPVLGNGWGTYKYFYHDEISQKERNYMDTHNIYLQLLSEIGIVGFIIFDATMIYFIYIAVKFNKKEKDIVRKRYILMFLTYHIYILLEGMIGNPIYDIPVLIPYGFLLVLFLNQINRREINE